MLRQLNSTVTGDFTGCEISVAMASALETVYKCSFANHKVLENFMYHKTVEVGKHHWTSPNATLLLTARSTTADCSGPHTAECPKMETPQPFWASHSHFLFLCKWYSKWWICQRRFKSQQNSFSLMENKPWQILQESASEFSFEFSRFHRKRSKAFCGNHRRNRRGKDREKPYALVECADLKAQKSCVLKSVNAPILCHIAFKMRRSNICVTRGL